MTTSCKCGCGEAVKGKRVFMNKEHHLAWMYGGGAKEMNALQSVEGKREGGRVAGSAAAASGRLVEAAIKSGKRNREIAAEFRRRANN